MKKIDIYGHIGLPRFTTAEEFLKKMDAHDVEQTLLSTAQFCPDILELSRAIVTYPDRFRAVGLPLGSDRQSIRTSVKAQLDSGFSGIRIHARAAHDDPELLDIVGREGKFALVVAFEAWTPYGNLLADFLDRYPDSFIIGGHFAGPGDARLLEEPSLNRLFGHERFTVAFTRQGHFDPAVLLPWAGALIRKLGWQRILWGSEWPVAIWRDESYAQTLNFIDQFQPDLESRQAFFYGNAKRLFFAGPATETRLLAQMWDLMPHKVRSEISLFPKSLSLPEELHQQVQQAYFSSVDNGTLRYSEYIVSLIKEGLSARPIEQGRL